MAKERIRDAKLFLNFLGKPEAFSKVYGLSRAVTNEEKVKSRDGVDRQRGVKNY